MVGVFTQHLRIQGKKCEGNHQKTTFFQFMKPSFFLHFQFQHHHSPKYIHKKQGVSSPKVFSLLGVVIYNRWMQHWRYPFILMAPWRSGRTWRTDVGTRPIFGHWDISKFCVCILYIYICVCVCLFLKPNADICI